MFKNSLAETLTETEKAFQLSFVAMTETILLAIQAVSFVVIVIIMAVMANTMAMTARERGSEYATLKALGFSGGFVARLILAESLGIALVGRRRRHRAHGADRPRVRGANGHALSDLLRERADDADPGRRRARRRASSPRRFPAWRTASVRIVDGLRAASARRERGKP